MIRKVFHRGQESSGVEKNQQYSTDDNFSSSTKLNAKTFLGFIIKKRKIYARLNERKN